VPPLAEPRFEIRTWQEIRHLALMQEFHILSSPMKKLVAVVEDDGQLRDQLVEILGTAPDIECVGAYCSGEEALKKIPPQNLDVVLMDIKLPKMSGIQCVAQLKRLKPSLQIIMVTVYKDNDRIFKALKAGADGYLIKSNPPHQLLDAVRDVNSGGAPISSHIARKVIEHFHLLTPSAGGEESLSQREQQVLSLLASGFIYKEIGDQLGIGVTTVRTYVINICQKMQVRNRLEAIAKCRNDLA
jgi:DNA-binding NarL/FixJ family response regulator